MKINLEVTYHPEYEGKFEPYLARVLDYPELQGYGMSPEEEIGDALAFLEGHLGRKLQVLREDVQLELAG
ncbi:hypothetical protein BH24DEI1_BH24DEI1_09640 [soil metagenome]